MASFFLLSITCLPWGQMEDMVPGTDRTHLFFPIISPLLQTCHFHRTHSHQYSYYLTVNSGTYVWKMYFSSSFILWRKHQMNGLCYADKFNYRVLSPEYLHRKYPQWQGSPGTSSGVPKSQIQGLSTWTIITANTQMLCLLYKTLGSCLVILDYLWHSGKEV